MPQEGAFAELDPDGTSVDIQVSDACALQQFEEVRRTHTDERVNETPVVDYTLAVLGAGAAITGAVVLADSGSVYESDETSRQYNPVGKGTAQAIGGITLAAGGIMLTIPIVDAARASGVEKRTTEESVPREALEERVACPRKLRPGRHVVGKVAGEDVELGTTDAQGRLSVDLSSTSIDELQARKNKRMQVFVDGERVGFLSLVPLAKARRRAADEKAWSDADPAACKALAHSEDCRGIERYLEHFPEGRHAEAAGDLLLAAKPKIPELRDNERWAEANAQACLAGETEDACDRVAHYVENLPNGSHIEEAKQVLEKGKKAIVRNLARKRAQEAAGACQAACAGQCSTVSGT